MNKRLFTGLMCVCIAMTMLSCTKETYPETTVSGNSGTVFRLAKAAYDGIGTRSSETAAGRYDIVFHHFADEDGNIIRNIKSKYDASTGQITAEGLHEGNYTLMVLGIDGNMDGDGAVINSISRTDDRWLVLPDSPDSPLEAEYFHSATPFTVKTETGDDGKLHEVAYVPESIVQKRIIARIDFAFSFGNPYVENSVTGKTVRLVDPQFCTYITADGKPGGKTDTDAIILPADSSSSYMFMPLAEGTQLDGEVLISTVNYLGESRKQSYGFTMEETEGNRIHTVTTVVKHPDDRIATMYITEDAMMDGEFTRILQDDEPVSVYTDRKQRSFNTAEPLQVKVTEEGKLHIRFYSPDDLEGVLVKARIPSVSEEFVDIAYFSRIPAFGDFTEEIPLTARTCMVRTESGNYIETGPVAAARLAEAEFRIESDDPYWKKLQKIEHGWTLYWGLFGGDPSREDGGPVGNWMGIRPVHCRESVAFFLNFTYMIDMPEHEQILRDNADQLYDDNKQPVKVEDVLAKMRRNQTLQVGLVYPGNGVIGLGSPSVFGAYQQGWFQHYFNTYACSVMFHELGHVMGYGHASSFTYGPWAEQLMNNFYVNNLGKMPVNDISLLSSAENPHRYM